MVTHALFDPRCRRTATPFILHRPPRRDGQPAHVFADGRPSGPAKIAAVPWLPQTPTYLMGVVLVSGAVGSTTDGGTPAGQRHRGYMSPRPTRLRDTHRPT